MCNGGARIRTNDANCAVQCDDDGNDEESESHNPKGFAPCKA